MFDVDFPTDTTSVKFRAVQWICTEVLLALAALLNFMPRTCLTLDPPSVSVADSQKPGFSNMCSISRPVWSCWTSS